MYKKLFALKKRNTTLWNGAWGATMARVWTTRPDYVLSFVRENDDDKVFAVINFSADEQSVSFSDAPFEGGYTECFTGEPATFDAESTIRMEP